MANYLQDLNERLADGVARLPAAVRERHARFFLGKQNADGGFPGRDPESDLYYTGFALRGLAVLDALTPEVCDRARVFLQSCLTRQTSVVDFFSLLYAALLIQASSGVDVFAGSPPDWPERVAATLDTFRTKDGGYNKSPGANSASTYHTFLVGLCYQLLGLPFPRPDEVLALVRGRKREDGGFVEISAMRRSGTNPTAGAVGILHLTLGTELPPEEVSPVLAFLEQMPSDEGGMRANNQIPLADLLSTFTGLWTMQQLGGLDRIDKRQAYAYVMENEVADGGFKAGLWDEVADVEYTFYGLGTLGLVVD